MPNHTATVLCLRGDPEQIRALTSAIGSELDFDSLFPCPEELTHVCSPVRIVSDEEFEKEKERYAREKAKPENHWVCGLRISAAYQKDLLTKYGADDWYTWCLENWGTKWGIYDAAIIGENVFAFNTAWSPATAFWLRVSKAYPDVEFDLQFADEGGFFVGFEIIRNGETTSSDSYEWNSPDGIRVRKIVGYGPADDEESVVDDQPAADTVNAAETRMEGSSELPRVEIQVTTIPPTPPASPTAQ